jgi:hypothetical protein
MTKGRATVLFVTLFFLEHHAWHLQASSI